MNFRDFLKTENVYLDGGMGTLLQKKGLTAGEYPERWNITHPDVITEIHRQYFDAGSNVVCTNTFGANVLKFGYDELEQIISAAVTNAKRARALSENPAPKFIALDIGPTGKLLKPLGDLDFEDAVSIFAKTITLGAKQGVDLIVIETMNDSYETKAALLAAKESCSLPIIVTNAYGEDGKLMTGASPEAMVCMLEGMGADAVGANCSLGPAQLRDVAMRLIECASVPVVLKPNAGLPRIEKGETVFDVPPSEFASLMYELMQKGVRVVGGCCGTTPEYIKELYDKTCALRPPILTDKKLTAVSSYTHAVRFENKPILIGERINPTGKKRFKQALLENDIDYILTEGIKQQEKGVHILDVNVGLPDIDEPTMLEKVVCELQAVCDLPLQIDSSDATAMEKALRRYNGKAMVNSVSGKKESMQAVFPLVKKYGGTVVALTLDENGIPDTAEGRVQIAKRILKTAAEYGIAKKDIIFDTLAMTVSADKDAAKVTLKALSLIKNELDCHTILGVSNISFGLPCRDAVNSTFFAIALASGLSAAIMNPHSADMMKAYYSYNALCGLDQNFEEYISNVQPPEAKDSALPVKEGESLGDAIVKGRKEKAAELTRLLLKNKKPLDIINSEIIPALDTVGAGFEKKTVYLPQLLISAESAKSAFEVIRESMQDDAKSGQKEAFVLATVKGDIHDIGKNIVKLLMENYGYRVIDLGKDVLPETVADAVCAHNAKLAGLSALMTTTVPAMEETVKLIRQKAPYCKIVVGGAVLTQEYANKIGADFYARDAMEAVRIAGKVFDGE